jgi:Acetyltransferase (GNAT) domain
MLHSMTFATRAFSLFLPRLGRSIAKELGFIDVLDRRKLGRAAVTAPRPITVKRLTIRQWKRMTAEFIALSARACDGNLHMSPASVTAAVDTLVPASQIIIIAAFETGDGEPDDLAGVWVLREGSEAWALGARTLVTPIIPDYEILGAPVIDKARAHPVMQAMLGFIASDPDLPNLIHSPVFPLEGETAAALKSALHAKVARMDAFETWTRAMVFSKAHETAEQHIARAAPTSLKRRQQSRRALEKSGQVTSVVRSGQAAIEAFDDFLALEDTGWKAQSGTSLAKRPKDAAYMRALVEEFAANHAVRMDAVQLEGHSIATGIMLGIGGSWHFMKSAYDENQRKYSPGVMLNLDMTQAIMNQPDFVRLDSGMGDMIDAAAQIWADQRAMGRVLIDLGAGPKARMTAEMLAIRRSLRAIKNNQI